MINANFVSSSNTNLKFQTILSVPPHVAEIEKLPTTSLLKALNLKNRDMAGLGGNSTSYVR